MMIELLIRKGNSQPTGAVQVCVAGFVAVVMSILLMFFASTGDVMACGGDPPGPDCPPCATPEGKRQKRAGELLSRAQPCRGCSLRKKA